VAGSGRALDAVGIGSMVQDRVHRTARILGRDEKGWLRDVDGRGPVRRCAGGVVLNQLGWAAALGLRTGICGRQADDEAGRFLRAAMDRLGIERHLVLEGAASSVAEIFVDDAGERSIYMAPGTTAGTSAQHVRHHHADFIRRAGRLVTEVSQLPLPAALAALEIAREARIPTVVDLDVLPSQALRELGGERDLARVLRAADLLKPAKAAAREIAPAAGGDALELARALRERFGNSAVVVTDGAAGCAIATEGFEGFVPGLPVKVLDATGAGDAFLGGLLAGLAHGLGWGDVGRLANACGGACAEQLGAFPEAPEAARARVQELYAGEPVALRPLSPGADAAASGAVAEVFAVFDVGLEELAGLRGRLEARALEAGLALIRRARAAGGRLHVTGIGKCEHVARYAAALLASTGTPATFLHATEAVHGSAGQVVSGDVVIAVSNSGETSEMRAALEAVRRMGARVLVVTGTRHSRLALQADAVIEASVAREGGPLGLAPRVSVAAEILVLAGLAAALERESGLTLAEYHARHPAGRLGERSR